MEVDPHKALAREKGRHHTHRKKLDQGLWKINHNARFAGMRQRSEVQALLVRKRKEQAAEDA